MNKVKEVAVEEIPAQVVETAVAVAPVVNDDVTALKALIAEMQAEHSQKMAEAKEAIEAAKLMAKEIGATSKEELKILKHAEAKEEAKKLAQLLKDGATIKVKRNLTQEIRECMVLEMTVDEIQAELSVPRKSILDRRWLIIQSLNS